MTRPDQAENIQTDKLEGTYESNRMYKIWIT